MRELVGISDGFVCDFSLCVFLYSLFIEAKGRPSEGK